MTPITRPVLPQGPSKKAGICRQFLRGFCHYGIKCRFIHDLAEAAVAAEKAKDFEQHDASAQQKLAGWKSSRPKGDKLTPEVKIWIIKALDLLNEAADAQQQIIKALASEKNLKLVAFILERGAHMSKEPKRSEFIQSLIMPLSGIMSHPRVVDSVVLEQEVTSLHQCLFSKDCAPRHGIFHRLIGIVQNSTKKNGGPKEDCLQALSLSVAILAKAVDAGVPAISVRHIEKLLTLLTSTVQEIPGSENNFHCIMTSKHVENMGRRLSPGQTLLTQALSTLQQDMPGKLR